MKIPIALPCFAILDISPDKTELLGLSQTTNANTADRPLWTLSIESGLTRRLGNLTGHAAAWSPDGEKIVYVTGKNAENGNDLYIAAKDGSNRKDLIKMEKRFVETIRWSPDGKFLRLISFTRPNDYSIEEMLLDGTHRHSIIKDIPKQNCCVDSLDWTSDGRYSVLRVFNTDSLTSEIWVRGEIKPFWSRSELKAAPLTTGATSFWNPIPSADSKQIFAIGGQPRGELTRYDIKSGKLEPVLSGISAQQLDFSRDGKWVAYSTFPDASLWRSKIDGSERMQLVSPPMRALEPRWSPDGTRIVFSAYTVGQPVGLYLVSADGGEPELFSQSQHDEVDASWSPDGNAVIFGGVGDSPKPEIFSLNLKTRRVSSVPGSEGLYSPRASHNGRFIAAMDFSAARKLMLFDQESQKWSELIDWGKPRIAWPEWSPDDRYVYVSDFSELSSRHVLGLLRVRIADREIERAASFEVREGITGHFGGWMSASPEGVPLLLRDLSIQEIYALDLDLP